MTDTITRSVHLPAALGDVWAAITDPERLAEWLADDITLELVPGGSAEFVVEGERRDGWIEEISPPTFDDDCARLTFWWQAADAPASRVEFEITRVPTGTHLRVRETRPLDILDLVGVPLRGNSSLGGSSYGPSLVATGAR